MGGSGIVVLSDVQADQWFWGSKGRVANGNGDKERRLESLQRCVGNSVGAGSHEGRAQKPVILRKRRWVTNGDPREVE